MNAFKMPAPGDALSLCALLCGALVLAGCGPSESNAIGSRAESVPSENGQPGPASNDDFADRMLIESLPFSHRANIDEATVETTEFTPSCLGGGVPAQPASLVFGTVSDQTTRNVWYGHRPDRDITITIDPTRIASTVILAAHEVVNDQPGAEIGCVDSNDGYTSLTLDLSAGQEYAIQVIRAHETAPPGYELRVVEGSSAPAPEVPAYPADTSRDPGAGDATVIAVVDVGLSPYHWDFHAAKMPQALDGNPANDLPLRRPPHEWLPGFPSPASFAAYEALDLTLEAEDPDLAQQDLFSLDASEWSTQTASTADAIAYHWIPGTKVIGALSFSPTATIQPAPGSINGDHGTGVSSAAVGNFHGACPECLLVFIDVDENQNGDTRNAQLRAAFRWAQAQPWIDVVVTSTYSVWEVPGSPERQLVGDRYGNAHPFPAYVGDPDDVSAQRAAAERGQTQFQCAGNGILQDFTLPNPTVTSSMMGPDWLVTVGGTGARGELLSGDGIQVDVTAPATWVAAANATVPVGRRTFLFGTSYAAPLTAGIYARSLYQLRRALPGASRSQDDGVVARTARAWPCGSARSGCELADGRLTAEELRLRLLQSAVPTADRATLLTGLLGQDATLTPPAPIDEEWRLAHEGHGAFRARHLGNGNLLTEVARVVDAVLGRAELPERPDGEQAWMIVDSYCRQQLWGEWRGGYHKPGAPTPGYNEDWPVRSIWEQTCPLVGPVPSLPPF